MDVTPLLSLDAAGIEVPDVDAAEAFYAALRLGEPLELHPGGAAQGFGGWTASGVFAQPGEVRAVMDAAARAGAQVLKPARKALFGSFSGHFRAPDGAVWELVSASRKDKVPVAEAPRPTESVVILGVAEPKRSKVFYEALGMTAEHDYGDKFVDFRIASGAPRLGLLPRAALAKSAAVDDAGGAPTGLVLRHRAGSPAAVAALLEAAVSAGARDSTPPGEDGSAGFTDPDGFRWHLTG